MARRLRTLFDGHIDALDVTELLLPPQTPLDPRDF